VRLFRDNIWKLHRLPESVVSDRGPQFAAECRRSQRMRSRKNFKQKKNKRSNKVLSMIEEVYSGI